jgi:hypothetical protein
VLRPAIQADARVKKLHLSFLIDLDLPPCFYGHDDRTALVQAPDTVRLRHRIFPRRAFSQRAACGWAGHTTGMITIADFVPWCPSARWN